MTREEAVIILRCVEAHGSLVKEAKEKAIEALEQDSILDKIRAEIEQLRLHKAQFLTSDNKVCIDSQEVLNIIDKYKAESEVKE